MADREVFFNDYQRWTTTLAQYPKGLLYPALKLNGEAGEVAEKVGKRWRDQNATTVSGMTETEKNDLIKEIGDVLWYCSALATELGVTLGYVAAMNIEKLESRRARGVLGGSGDNR